MKISASCSHKNGATQLEQDLLIELWPLKELLRLSTEPPAFSLGLSRESVSGGGDCGEPGMTPGLDSCKALNHFSLVNEHRYWQELLVHIWGENFLYFPALQRQDRSITHLSTYLVVLSCGWHPTLLGMMANTGEINNWLRKLALQVERNITQNSKFNVFKTHNIFYQQCLPNS